MIFFASGGGDGRLTGELQVEEEVEGEGEAIKLIESTSKYEFMMLCFVF